VRRLLSVIPALLATVWLAVFALVRMPLLAEIGPEQATRALRAARESLIAGTDVGALDALAAPQAGLPVVLSLYDAGAPVARGIGRGDTLGAALRQAIDQLRSTEIDAAVLERGRLKLDRVQGRGGLSSSVVPLFALGAVPGRDGIAVVERGREVLLTSDDLIRARLWSGYQPLPFMEFQLGLDVPKAVRVLARELGEGSRWLPRKLYRFRAEEYLERLPATRASQPALRIIAGHAPGPEVSREALMDGARAGGAFLLEHLSADGRFDYEYYTLEDSRVTAGYSIPRHAGATTFLAQLYALDHDPPLRAATERALQALEGMQPAGCGRRIWPRICVGEDTDRIVDLGSAALSLVAATEYQRTTGDRRFLRFALGLAEFVLWMQKPDGDYCHLFDTQTGERDEKTQLLYYSGEAAYGLARLLALSDELHDEPTQDRAAQLDPALLARAATGLDKSLQYLTDGAYASFTSKFYVGEDHWTCMALDAGWEHLPAEHRERYARFCDEFSRFLRRSQLRPGESLVETQPQLAGGYGITSLLAPHTTPVGSRSETTISMWRIARKRGLPPDDRRVREPREQVLDGMRFLLARQFRPELELGGDHLLRNPAAARGGLPMSDVERHVRIDFIQHSCSAMLRALEML
jgi:hypothetical protein